MAKKTKAKAKSTLPVVVIHGEEHSTPVTVSVGGMRFTFKYGKPTEVPAEVMEALKNTAGINYTLEGQS